MQMLLKLPFIAVAMLFYMHRGVYGRQNASWLLLQHTVFGENQHSNFTQHEQAVQMRAKRRYM